MTDLIRPWADLHQSSVLPWLSGVSTSETLVKGEDYRWTSSFHMENANVRV